MVAEDGVQGPALSPDSAARRPGRGAWLHPTARCLDLALRRRALVRALGRSGSPSVQALRDWVTENEPGSPGVPPAVGTVPTERRRERTNTPPGTSPAGVPGQTESGFDADEQSMSTQQ